MLNAKPPGEMRFALSVSRFAFSIKKGLSTCVNSPGVYKAGFLRVHSFECRFCFHDQALTNAGWAWLSFFNG